jgi:5-methylthioribose kinase
VCNVCLFPTYISIFGIKIAPDGIAAWNPSFDVTPCSLIRGVITEVGVAEAASDAGSDGIIDIAAFLRSKGMAERCKGAVTPTAMPTGFKKLDEAGIAAYVAGLPSIRKILGIKTAADASLLSVAEVGDGNLNFVYIVSGPEGGKVVAKQALPYVRCVGESWPLTLERANFEFNALVEQRKLAPEYVPEVYHFDKTKALISKLNIAAGLFYLCVKKASTQCKACFYSVLTLIFFSTVSLCTLCFSVIQ